MTDKKQPEPMTLQQAQQQLTAAAGIYDQLTHQPTRNMDAAARAAHQSRCRQALSDKRYLAACVEALAHLRPVPDRASLYECRV